MTYPPELQTLVRRALTNPHNLGLLVWVEEAPAGVWTVHAGTPVQRLQAMDDGRYRPLAAEVLNT